MKSTLQCCSSIPPLSLALWGFPYLTHLVQNLMNTFEDKLFSSTPVSPSVSLRNQVQADMKEMPNIYSSAHLSFNTLLDYFTSSWSITQILIIQSSFKFPCEEVRDHSGVLGGGAALACSSEGRWGPRCSCDPVPSLSVSERDLCLSASGRKQRGLHRRPMLRSPTGPVL